MRLAIVVTAVLAITCVAPAATHAQNHFPLEITSPRNAQSANHRTNKAYTGTPYVIRIAAIGGSWPYTYEIISGAGAGMTIDGARCTQNAVCTAGTITWPNPAANATPTIRVCDMDGDCVTETWTITVSTAAASWKFVNAVSGNDANNGSIGSPWRTLNAIFTSSTPAQCVYFRTGTYTTVGITTSGILEGLHVVLDGSDRSACLIEYPGESAVIDLLSDGVQANYRPHVLIQDSDSIWLSGFTVQNAHIMGLRFAFDSTPVGPTLYNLSFQNLRVGLNGSNSAFIFTTYSGSFGPKAYAPIVQNTTFFNFEEASAAIKLYSTNKTLVEDSIFDTSNDNDSEGFAAKINNLQFTIRNSRFSNIVGYGIGGNHSDPDDVHQHSGEILFNSVFLCGIATMINQNGEAGPTYAYRNTFQGRVLVRNVSTDDGPFPIVRNVIENNDTGSSANPPGSHIVQEGSTDPSRVIVTTCTNTTSASCASATSNLVGTTAGNVVDSIGLLTAAYASHRGVRGHDLSGGIVVPTQVQNLRLTQP